MGGEKSFYVGIVREEGLPYLIIVREALNYLWL